MEPNNTPSPGSGHSPATEATPKPKRSRMVIPILIVLVLGGGLAAWLVLSPSLSTDNAMIERTKATVSAKMIGLISHIKVEEGQFADKGAALVELDTAEAEATTRQDKADLASAQGDSGSKRIDFDGKTADFERAKSQYAGKIISTEAFEHSRQAYETARVNYQSSLDKVASAQAKLDKDTATLNSMKIQAPFDAVVAKKWMNEGDVLQPGQPILTLYERHGAWVTANFEETKIATLHPGQPVSIHVDAFPGVEFHGKVKEIGTNTGNQFSLIPVNNAAGNFTKVTQRIPVKIEFDDSTDLGNKEVKRLLPGMSATVDIHP